MHDTRTNNSPSYTPPEARKQGRKEARKQGRKEERKKGREDTRNPHHLGHQWGSIDAAPHDVALTVEQKGADALDKADLAILRAISGSVSPANITGHVGRSRSASCRALVARWRRPDTPRRPHNEAATEENREHRSTHCSNLIADEMRDEHRLTGGWHRVLRYISPYRFLPALLNRRIPTPPQCVDIAASSARIKFDDEQFAALFNELQSRGDKAKLMQFVWTLINLTHEMCYNSVLKMIF